MPLSSREKDNLTRWNESKKGFYEVYYLKWNDPAQQAAGWIRYTLNAPLDRPVEVSVWAVFFDAKDPTKNCGLKKTFPLHDARIEREFFYFAAGPSAIYDSGARGDLSDNKNKFSWELKFEEPSESLRHYPSLLYSGGFPKTKFLAPYLTTRLSGEFAVNGRRFILDKVPAHEGHLWGTEMANFWTWGNCNTFEEDSTFCFEGLSARLEMGGKPTPPLTLLFFLWQDKIYAFNSPKSWLTNKSEVGLDRWHFEARSRDHLFVGDVTARPTEMAGVRYENPTGGERFCHNTKTADLTISILKETKGNWKTVETLHARHSAAFEVVQPALDQRVRLLIP